MNQRQIDFISILEKHHAKQISVEAVDTWLAENIRPLAIPRSAGWNTPGLILEKYVYQNVSSSIMYMQEFGVTDPVTELKEYWVAVKSFLDFLKGYKIYRHAYDRTMHSIDHKWRRYDRWMVKHLEYAEMMLQKLKNVDKDILDFKKINVSKPAFDQKSVTEQTIGEIMMREIFEIIDGILVALSDDEQDEVISQNSLQIKRLENLLACFKGERPYSLSVTFEGLDKFSLILMV